VCVCVTQISVSLEILIVRIIQFKI